MAVNYYNQPAQAQFINTYVPIPFEDLNNLANVARQERKENEQKIENYFTKYGEFQSRSQTDMGTWNREVTDRVKDVASQIVANPDAIKGEEGRMLVSGLVNNTNYGLLSRLRQNAQNLEEGYKTYDRRWNDGTLESIVNWDTTSQGLYENQNLEYKSIHDLTNPYFDKLQLSFDPKLSNGQFDYYSISDNDLNRAASTALNELYADPTMQKHYRRLGLDKLPREKQIQAMAGLAKQTQTDRLQVKREMRKDYLSNLEFSQRMAVERLKQAGANQRAAAKRAGTGQTQVDGVPNRSEYVMNGVVKSIANSSPIKGGNKSYKDFLTNGTINSGNPVLDKRLGDYRAQYSNLINKYNQSQNGGPKLTTDEMKSLSRLQGVIEDVARITPEMDEINNQIKVLAKGLEGLGKNVNGMNPYIQELQILNRELTTNRFSALAPDLFNNGTKNAQEAQQREQLINKRLNERFGKVYQMVKNNKNISAEQKEEILRQATGQRSGVVNKTEINDYLAISVGDPVYETNVIGSSLKKGGSTGVRAVTANKIKIKDFNMTNGIGSTVDYADNSRRGQFAKQLFTNPTSFDLPIEEVKSGSSGMLFWKEENAIPDEELNNITAAKFGGNIAPVIIDSKEGRVDLKRTNNINGQAVYAPQIEIKIPKQSIEKYILQNDIKQNNKSGKAKQATVEDLLKDVTGDTSGKNIRVTKINGVEYYVIDGETEMFNDAGEMNMFNHQISTRGVKLKSSIPNTNNTPNSGYFTDGMINDEDEGDDPDYVE